MCFFYFEYDKVLLHFTLVLYLHSLCVGAGTALKLFNARKVYYSLVLSLCGDRVRRTSVILRGLSGFRVIMAVCQTGADELLQDSLSYGHHHGCG